MLDGNVSASRDLLNTSYKISGNISEFALIIFVGTSDSWHALELSRFKISFLITNFEKGWNENCLTHELSIDSKNTRMVPILFNYS